MAAIGLTIAAIFSHAVLSNHSAMAHCQAFLFLEAIMTDMPDSITLSNDPFADWAALIAAQTKLENEIFDLNKTALLNALASAGVTRVVVAFDGYGDSGQIGDIEVHAGDERAAMPNCMVEMAEVTTGQAELSRSPVNIAIAIENMAYGVLKKTHCGWENEDGAFGDVTFDVAEQTITLDYNERYTATEFYCHQF